MPLNIEFASKIESFKSGLAGPFFIFDSATNLVSKTLKVRISHDKTMKSLKAYGYDAYAMSRFSKKVIKAAIVFGEGAEGYHLKNLLKMSELMGNEYCIWSNGAEIFKIFHTGKRKGKRQLASDPVFHLIRPDTDCFSLPYNSAHFTLSFHGEPFGAAQVES